METNKEAKNHAGTAFFWGLIIGALLATLLTTKKGRQILRELINLGLELIEEFIEGRKSSQNHESRIMNQVQEVVEMKDDEVEEEVDSDQDFDEEDLILEKQKADKKKILEELDNEIAEVETASVREEEEAPVKKVRVEAKETPVSSVSHAKKRLFRGIRKSKAN